MSGKLPIKKPISIWKKPIEISTGDLLSGIGKAVLKGISLDWSGVGESALDTLDSAGLRETPNESAWLLIFRSIISAISKLTFTFSDQFGNKITESAIESSSKNFEMDFEKVKISIDLDFFRCPAEHQLVKEIRQPIIKWFKGLGAPADVAKKIADRFPDYFETALNEKWQEAPQEYSRVYECFNTPFTKASEDTRRWKLYNQWLKNQVCDRMFAEPFGVEKVYVPLRGYFEEYTEMDFKQEKGSQLIEKVVKRVVIDLEKDFKEWLENFSQSSAVRFLSGGPGSGKSTFAKVFASRIANETKIPTLYIPLHLFDPSDNLISSMEKFVRNNKFLTGNPLEAKEGKARLFIIFDGLDELALQGKASNEVANAFVDEVLRRIQEGNSQGLQRQILISGRTIAIQSVAQKLREPKQLTYVLPYYHKKEYEKVEYYDPEKLLQSDQRDDWWRMYGSAIGKKYSGLPTELSRKGFEEITSQPLLNYLVALSYEQKRTELADDTTLNQIYKGLIKEVYTRQYEGRVSACVGALKETEFIRVLEEIALAIWHGDGRTATVSSIHEKCNIGGIQKYLDSFQEGAKAGVTRLLTAFYFRQSEQRSKGDQTFEFTHKTFGEFLTALRLVRVLNQILTQRKRQEENPDDGWGIRESLEQWTKFCSPTIMDRDLFRFLANEIKAMEHETLESFQHILCDLLTYSINNGIPLYPENEKRDFKDQLRNARNSEEALLAVHYAVASITKKVSKLKFKTHIDFGEWIGRLRGQRQGPNNTLALESLGYLDLSNCVLDIQDFYGANFVGSILDSADLHFAIFDRANLSGASLKNSRMMYARLEGASLDNANLKGCNLRGVEFNSSEFLGKRTSLRGANLENAHLEYTNLQNVNLDGANLRNAFLEGAKIDRIVFQNASFKDAQTKGVLLLDPPSNDDEDSRKAKKKSKLLGKK